MKVVTMCGQTLFNSMILRKKMILDHCHIIRFVGVTKSINKTYILRVLQWIFVWMFELIIYGQWYFISEYTDINDCLSGPCQNNGICTDLVNDYRCDCVAGFDGTNCEDSKHYILTDALLFPVV